MMLVLAVVLILVSISLLLLGGIGLMDTTMSGVFTTTGYLLAAIGWFTIGRWFS